MTTWYRLHDDLVFTDYNKMLEHEKDCPKCAPFVAARKARAEFFAKRVAEAMAARRLAREKGDGR